MEIEVHKQPEKADINSNIESESNLKSTLKVDLDSIDISQISSAESPEE